MTREVGFSEYQKVEEMKTIMCHIIVYPVPWTRYHFCKQRSKIMNIVCFVKNIYED